MNFRQLTSEELEPLAKEFTLFLSANGIDANHWESMKTKGSSEVIALVKQFSDSVWYKIFINRRYINFEEVSAKYYMDFLVDHCIIMKVKNVEVGEYVEISMQERKYKFTREEDMFQWINQGATFSEGKEYKECCVIWAERATN